MGTDREWRHALDFADLATSVSKARDFVAKHLLDHDLRSLVDDLQLVVSELATNALVHGHSAFEVVLRETDGVVRLEVHDGSGALPVMIVADDLDTGGRGVLIVDSLSREWGAAPKPSGGKSVWAEFERPAAG